MKTFLSILVLAALTSVASAAVSQPGRNIPCRGPFMRPGGPVPVGSPSVRVVEQLVPMGPMLPAFKHVYYLAVRPMYPNAPTRMYALEGVDSPTPGVQVYKAVTQDGQDSGYMVQQNMFDNPMTFTVYVGKNGMHYQCK